jgi:hypothetical protein
MYRLTAPLQWSSDLFWETGAFVSTEGLFYRNAEFHGSLATWNARRVVTMESTFEYSGIVDSGVGAWDTRSLRTAGKMFSGAMNLHPGFDLSRWNVSQLVDLHSMFRRSSIVHAGFLPTPRRTARSRAPQTLGRTRFARGGATWRSRPCFVS